MDIVFESVLPIGLVAAIGAVLIAAVIVLYAKSARPMRRGNRLAMILLRATAITAIIFVLLSPNVRGKETLVERAPLVVLVDCSKSMSIRDCPGDSGRIDSVMDAIAKNSERFDALAEKFDTQFYGFGEGTFELDATNRKAESNETAIGSAMDSVMHNLRGRKNGMLLLLSDGNSNTGKDPLVAAGNLGKSGAKVNCLTFGTSSRDAGFKDIKVQNLDGPATTFINSKASFKATVTAIGMSGKPISVKFDVDGEVVKSERFVPGGGGIDTSEITFKMDATKEGLHKVTVTAEPYPGELTVTNNSQSTFVNVLTEGLTVCLLENNLRWESRFVKRALQQIGLVKFEMFVLSQPDSKPPTEMGRYRVIIIGDVPASKLGEALCKDIRDAVEKTGSGLIMLGGENTFGMGGYDNSPLAEIMPVRMGASDVRAVEQCHAVPTLEGAPHPVVQIGLRALENDAAWKGLPALDSFVRFGETKPAAITLLETETGRAPMLVTQSYGKGNTMVFAPDATWKWAMHSDDASELYTKLWHNIISWLSQKSENRKKSVWISLDRFLYFPRETVTPRVNVRDEEGKTVNNAVVELTMTPPGKPAVLCPTAFTANSYSCALSPADGGEYVLDAKVTVDGKPFGSDSTRFIVQVPDVEMDSPFANHNYLATLASVSGGTSTKLEDLSALLDRLKDSPNLSTFDIPTKRPLWDKIPLIMIFCAALAAEWVLRRRNRMI